MADIRLIATDLDGTLVGHGNFLPEINRRALQEAQEAGVMVVIASGRCYATARLIAKEIGLDAPMIIANGGAVYDHPDGELIFEDRMPGEMAQFIYETMRKENVLITSYVPGKIYRLNTPALKRGLSEVSMQAGSVYFEVINEDKAGMETCGLDRPYKMEAHGDDTDALERLRAIFQEKGYSVSSAFSTNLEILAPGGGKGRALRFLQNKYDIASEVCMAFGDNLNDLDMLRSVKFSVAMENGSDALKREAALIAPVNTDGGVGQIVEKYVL